VTPYYDDGRAVLYVGHVLDVLAQMPAGSIQTVVTSPPYWGLRAYGTDPQVWGGAPDCAHQWAEQSRAGLTVAAGEASPCQSSTKRVGAMFDVIQHATCTRCGAWRGELGSEPTPDCLAWARGQEPCSVCFVCHLVVVFRAVRRVLHDSGCIFVNLGDSYSGSGKGPTGHNGIGDQGQRQGFVDQRSDVPGLGPKQLMMMPARVALALQADGWVLRSDIIWGKLAPMPESVRDRPTNATEHILLLAKNPTYFYDAEAVRQPYSPMTTDTPQRQRMLANGKTSRAADFYGALTGERGGVGERMLHLNESGANLRNLWVLGPEPYPQAHFATFVSEIPRRAILAGTSARGQCPACGAPWRRETEFTYRKHRPSGGKTSRIERGNKVHDGGAGGWGSFGTNLRKDVTTTGWSPTCPCNAGDAVPQVCLDPFAGSGTTLAVARWHQRRAVGIELNPEYARLIEQRLAQGVLL
jgi:DNA modification methylase